MKELKISCIDFWGTFNPDEWFIVKALREFYNVHIVEPTENPDFIISSDFGIDRYNYLTQKLVHYSGENMPPDLFTCDWAITMTEDTSRNLYVPLAVETLESEFKHVPNYTDPSRPFCSCVISNMDLADPQRARIAEVVNSYKPVDFGGRWRNNVGGPVDSKYDFIRKYKFNLALENTSCPYYITEKLTEAFAAGTIPIYWGAPNVEDFFDAGAFINANKFNTSDELLKEISRIDNNPEVFAEYLSKNPARSTIVTNWKIRLHEFVEKILRTGKITQPYGRQAIMRYFRLKCLEAYSNANKKEQE